MLPSADESLDRVLGRLDSNKPLLANADESLDKLWPEEVDANAWLLGNAEKPLDKGRKSLDPDRPSVCGAGSIQITH